METRAEQSACTPVPKARLLRSHISSHVAHGVQVVLETDVDLLECLPSPLIPGAGKEYSASHPSGHFHFYKTQSPGQPPFFTIAENGTPLFRTMELEPAVRTLESRIHQHVAAVTDQAIFVHAGVVRWRDKAIVIPGFSHAGKSTLVSALVAAGLTYYSDEYAVVDFDGKVHAFPRQLRLRPDMLRNASATGASAVTANGALEPLPLGWVLKTRYHREGTWAPQYFGPGRTLLTLLENTVAVRRQSELTLRTLKRAVNRAIGFESERGEAAVTARQIIDFLETTELRASGI